MPINESRNATIHKELVPLVMNHINEVYAKTFDEVVNQMIKEWLLEHGLDPLDTGEDDEKTMFYKQQIVNYLSGSTPLNKCHPEFQVVVGKAEKELDRRREERRKSRSY